MNDLSNLATEETQEISMQLVIDNSEGTVLNTTKIPALYKWATLPMHEAVVQQGLHGILIKQGLEKEQFAIYVHHSEFRHPTVLMLNIIEPCTCYFFSVMGSPVFMGMDPGNLSEIVLEARSITELKFNLVTDIHRMIFGVGTYISICVVVADDFKYLLEDEQWIYDLLMEYDKMIYKPPTPGHQ